MLYTKLRFFFFFVVLPKGCKSFHGPFPEDCLATMWYDAGCLPSGLGHPHHITASKKINQYDSLSLRYSLDDGCLTIANLNFFVEIWGS